MATNTLAGCGAGMLPADLAKFKAEQRAVYARLHQQQQRWRTLQLQLRGQLPRLVAKLRWRQQREARRETQQRAQQQAQQQPQQQPQPQPQPQQQQPQQQVQQQASASARYQHLLKTIKDHPNLVELEWGIECAKEPEDYLKELHDLKLLLNDDRQQPTAPAPPCRSGGTEVMDTPRHPTRIPLQSLHHPNMRMHTL
jgi:hypothetical protein